jgi:Pyridoxamine 5'-phosphate oxidase
MRSDEYATVAGLDEVAPAFVEMANRVVYCTLATVDRRGRPRTRMVHTLWEWDGTSLVGWVGSLVTPMKRAHLESTPFVSCSYCSDNARSGRYDEVSRMGRCELGNRNRDTGSSAGGFPRNWSDTGFARARKGADVGQVSL